MAENVNPNSPRGGNQASKGEGQSPGSSTLPFRHHLIPTQVGDLWPSGSRDLAYTVLQRVRSRGGEDKDVTLAELRALGIRVVNLSHTDGTSGDKGQQFFRLAKADYVDAIAGKYQFRQNTRRPGLKKGGRDNWHWSYFLSIWFENSLDLSDFENSMEAETPLERSRWHLRGNREKIRYESRYNIDNCWTCHFVLEEKNGSRPHLIAFLGDNNTLDAETLNISEVFAVVKMCACGHYQEMHKEHKIIPVTVITSSHVQHRIIQGFADTRTSTFIIRKSKIFVDQEPRWFIHRTIFQWLLSDPIGITL